MKAVLLTLVCALALSSAYEVEGEIVEIEVNVYGCPVDFTQQMFLPHKYCNRYNKCVAGLPVVMKCPPLTAYHIENKICDWIEHVECEERPFAVDEEIDGEIEEKPVTQKPYYGFDDPSMAPEICAQKGSDGILISHEECSKYYQCLYGKPIVQKCQDNLFYNPAIGGCDWQANVNCTQIWVDNPEWTHAERECSKGFALVPSEYCNWFYQCGPKGPIEIPCGPGTVFDFDIQVCNWPQFVNCGNKPWKPLPVEPEVEIDEEKIEIVEVEEDKEEIVEGDKVEEVEVDKVEVEEGEKEEIKVEV